MVDSNRLYSDPDPGSHVHSDPDPATDPNRIRINTDPAPDPTNTFQIFSLNQTFDRYENDIFETEVLFTTRFKVNIFVL